MAVREGADFAVFLAASADFRTSAEPPRSVLLLMHDDLPKKPCTPREAVVHSEETWGPQGAHSGNKHHPSET
ncbi:Rho Guanine Nucleotide Exchange Factor 40 [Manis pentadactyla]|nr:Rho Guanine Nucleotide Exchange Factor 40 [Manis pentadactyla]